VSTLPPPPTPDLQRLALLDLAQRARGGLALHLALWLLIGVFSGLAGRSPLLFWLTGMTFGANMVVRWWTEKHLSDRLSTDLPLARASFVGLLLANPLVWGLACAAEMARPSGTQAGDWIWFTLTGVAASGGISLSIDPLVRRLYAALAVLPPSLVMLMFPHGDRGFHLVAVLLFLLYVRHSSRVVHTDYWSAACARAELEQRARELELMSCTDTLTQVANRLHFDRRLAQEWARARRERTPVALMMIDVDHFKRVNDEFGHAFGDTCLQEIARALRAALTRPGDLLARYGGEEFVVMLPGTDNEGAMLVAERLHAAVAALTLHVAARSTPLAVPVACSIGVFVAGNPAAGSPASALEHADEALYQAKRLGRNRVVMLAGPA
jgi:diguanylate cyclase (GGDEF)-like protein